MKKYVSNSASPFDTLSIDVSNRTVNHAVEANNVGICRATRLYRDILFLTEWSSVCSQYLFKIYRRNEDGEKKNPEKESAKT